MRLIISAVILGVSLGMRPQYHPQCVVDSLEDYTDLCYKTFSSVSFNDILESVLRLKIFRIARLRLLTME